MTPHRFSLILTDVVDLETRTTWCTDTCILLSVACSLHSAIRIPLSATCLFEYFPAISASGSMQLTFEGKLGVCSRRLPNVMDAYAYAV